MPIIVNLTAINGDYINGISLSLSLFVNCNNCEWSINLNKTFNHIEIEKRKVPHFYQGFLNAKNG